ncbi:hypothetical protein K7887_18450 [Sutcliffiella horikoshii]|uniref:hypothetical protein n=1 Tax=Sutcliffiella horikoshii TaxID=79883 RepID=UPI001CBE4C0D|nr:hypothetical protein [Sutcliffiella horikoshii]UAL46823.1 hypothetical protein K7887_18450 [Sutcliffiella horikoshii]
MVLNWRKGNWIQLTYIHRSGDERGLYAFIESLEEFQAVMKKYKVLFEDIMEFSMNGKACSVELVRSLFFVRPELVVKEE